ALGGLSQPLCQGFAAEVEQASGVAVDLRQEGTLVVALNPDDQARLRHQLTFQHSLGLPLDWISALEARRREPHLAGITGAVFSPEDHQVDNRKLVQALRGATTAAGATVREHSTVEEVVASQGRVTGVRLADGTHIAAGAVVLAAGAWSRSVAGVLPALRPPVR